MAYKKWSLSDLRLTLVDDMSEGPVVTVEVTTPDGIIAIMGEPRDVGRTLVAERVHIDSYGIIKANDIGIRNLRTVAALIMEELGYDEIRVEGETRTTGANPQRRPRPIRFTRDRHLTGR